MPGRPAQFLESVSLKVYLFPSLFFKVYFFKPKLSLNRAGQRLVLGRRVQLIESVFWKGFFFKCII